MRLLLILLFLFFAGPAPAQSGDPLTRIAFGSCADEDEPQPIWDAITAYKPDLFIFAGDNVYGDRDKKYLKETDDLMAALEQSYKAARELRGFQAMRSIPHLAIWDDHDFGFNDAGGDFPQKVRAKELFLDFWNIPVGDPRRSREGLYHAETFGPPGQRVQVILLDTRYFRSPLNPRIDSRPKDHGPYGPDSHPARTMLGSGQWTWLGQQLRQPAELRLIVSSIQVLAGHHGWERWGDFPLEQQRLYDLIRGTEAKGVVLLSGDRHVGGLYHALKAGPYPLTEITSSGLNKGFRDATEYMDHQIGKIHGSVNFGTIDIDWNARSVVLSLRNVDGKVRRSIGIHMDELQ
jgi:alkaline phosphatase D